MPEPVQTVTSSSTNNNCILFNFTTIRCLSLSLSLSLLSRPRPLIPAVVSKFGAPYASPCVSRYVLCAVVCPDALYRREDTAFAAAPHRWFRVAPGAQPTLWADPAAFGAAQAVVYTRADTPHAFSLYA